MAPSKSQSAVTTTSLARRLLDLQAEYTDFEESEAILAGLGDTPDRTRDDIASDYATALREFMSR